MNQKADVTGNITFGAVFIAIGGLVLLKEFEILEVSWAYLLPIVLIAAGLGVIVSSQIGNKENE